MRQATDKHWSDYYDQGKDFALVTSSAITKFLDFIDPTLPKTCLDIGCGTGQLTRELAHRGYTCLGIDASSSAVKIAKSLTVGPKLQYFHFDIENDGIGALPDQPYSLITCKLVYAFIKDKAAFLQKVSTLLASGGTFIIITPLKLDVPLEKTGIAVDYDTTLAELKDTFAPAKTYSYQGMAYFICKKR
ncbi:MAG: class I SAM-dependent methyltransferase [Candidatus Saccharimonadales bacterium]